MHQAAFNSKRPHTRRDIAAVAGVGDKGLVYADLGKGIVHIRIVALRRSNDSNLAGYRGGTPQTINLTDIRTSHQPQQQCVPLRPCRRQILFQNIQPTACAAAHQAARNFIMHRTTRLLENFVQTDCRQ